MFSVFIIVFYMKGENVYLAKQYLESILCDNITEVLWVCLYNRDRSRGSFTVHYDA